MKNFITSAITATIICLIIGTIGYALYLTKAPFGVELPSVVALFETSLSSKIASSSTTMTLVSGTDKDGTTLSGKFGFIIDEGGSDEEFVIADCVDTACTGMLRGISVVDGNTETSALKKPHRRGASVKMTNYPILGILQRLASGSVGFDDYLYYTETIGTTGFSGTASTSNFATKYYVDEVGAGGFTAANVETSDGIAALGSSPETVGINIASTSGFYFESGGGIALYASTSNPLFIDDDGQVQVSTTASFTFGDLTFTRASVSDSLTVSDIFHTSTIVLDTALDETYGGTGTTSWDTNDICYISADNTFGAISSGSDGQALIMDSGSPGWGSIWSDNYIDSYASTSQVANGVVTDEGALEIDSTCQMAVIDVDDTGRVSHAANTPGARQVILFRTGMTAQTLLYEDGSADYQISWTFNGGTNAIDVALSGTADGQTHVFAYTVYCYK